MAEWGGPTSLALKLGHANGSFLSQLAGPHPSRKISEDTARSIEKKLALAPLWMDQDHGLQHPPKPTPVQADLLASVTKAVLLAVRERGGDPTIEKVADVVALAYKHAQDTGKVDPHFIQSLLKLVG
jgi:hypothetical protein